MKKTKIFTPIPGESTSDMLARLRKSGRVAPSYRMIKNPEQIIGCREAGRINSLVLDAVEREIKVGMTTQDIDDVVMEETKRLGGIPACLGFEGFPKSVCTSLNNVICHGIPNKKDVIKEGDIINVDCTTIYGGYFGDASRMFTFGEVDPEAQRLVQLTRDAVAAAVAELKPYTHTLGDIGYRIHTMARKAGYSVVREIGGHGVGLEMHEDPYVCHIGMPGTGITLVPGMIFTIEPMINQGKPLFTVDELDGWTIRTLDGKLSAQVENEILITETGYELLSK